MTPAEKARLFGQIWSLLDSDQPGERQAALDKLATLRAKMAWPSFGDMLRRGIAHYVNARVNKRRAIYRLSRPEASHCDASVLHIPAISRLKFRQRNGKSLVGRKGESRAGTGAIAT